MHRTKLRNKLHKEKTTLTKLGYSKQRNICVSIFSKSKKRFWESRYQELSQHTLSPVQMSRRRLKDVFSVTNTYLPRYTSSCLTRRLEGVLKTPWNCLEDVLEDEDLSWLRKTFFVIRIKEIKIIILVTIITFHFFSYQGFLSRILTTHRTVLSQGKGGDHLLFHSTISTRLRTFRHLFATLHVRLLSYIFNRTAWIYQTATRLDLSPYRIPIWLIDDVILVFVYLLDDLIPGFCYSSLTRKTGRLELASTITLVLQANKLTKYASHS